MSPLSPQRREIVARLQSGRLMICDGQGDPNSDGCGGQGYTGAAGQEPCRHCYGAGVMTPELRSALASAPAPSDPAGAGGDLGELAHQLREEIINREARRREILECIEDQIGTAWICCHCGYSTYHSMAYECADCGADMPDLHRLAFKLHARNTDNEDLINEVRAAFDEESAYRSGQLVPAFAAANPSGKPTWIERAAWCAEQILPLIPEEWGEQRDTIEKAVPGTSIPHLRWMARQLAECQVDSETKACRWLGWLQHGIVSCCLSTLEDEKARNLASATKARQGRDDEGGSVEDAGAAPAGETPEVTPSIPPSPRKGQEENPCPMTVEEAREELAAVDLAFEGLEETDRARRIGHWIGLAAAETTRANAAEAERTRLEAENERLRAALRPFARAISEYSIRGADLRAATAALAQPQPQPEERK